MFYDLDGFLNSVKYLSRQDILDIAYKKHKSLDKATLQEKKDGAASLQKSIQHLLYWLENQTRPGDISDQNFQKFLPICEHLIEKKELEPKSAEAFNYTA